MQRGTWSVCYEKAEASNTSKGEERGDETYFEWVNHGDSTMQSLEIFWASQVHKLKLSSGNFNFRDWVICYHYVTAIASLHLATSQK